MAVLFDLDGTLFDTSDDLHQAVNQLLDENGKPPVSYEQVRTLISMGAKGILSSVEKDPEHLIPRLIEIVGENGFANTKPFPGIEALLSELENRNITWGIVTNRIQSLTTPLLSATGFTERPACVVCGDTTLKKKPSPDPLLHACILLDRNPADCVYIGDALTDIQAGKAAGMPTVAAGFGFINPSNPVSEWDADHIVNHPDEILPWIDEWSKAV